MVKKLLFYVSLLWVIAAFAYAFYEQSTEAGLYAKLLGWQLETFGSAGIKLTTLGAGIIYGLPGLIILSLTRSAPRPPDPVAGQRNAAILLLAFGLLLILVGIGAYVLNMTHTPRSSAEGESASAPRLVSVDLDSAAGIPPADGADGVAVTGWLRRDAQYMLEEKGYVSKKTIFCPFVGARWSASEPVKVFLRADPTAPIAVNRPAGGGTPAGFKLPKGFVPVDFAAQTPLRVTIEGLVRPGRLPDYVAASFSKEGVKVAGDYVVLEAKPFFEGGVRSEWDKFAETSYLLTYLTVPLGVMFCLLSLIPFVRWRKAAQGRRVENP